MGMAVKAVIIYFGVLHCLGVCMILWAVFRRFPSWLLAVLGGGLVALGLWFKTLTVQSHWLFWLGRVLYREKTSLLPGFRCRPLEWIGRHSLPIYLLHQPILTGLLFLIYYL